jgi:hypothetical protein
MKKSNLPDGALRVVLVAGMLILVVFALVGITKIVPKAITSIGSAFSSVTSSLFSPKEKIVLSLSNNSVQSGEPVDVSFEHSNKTTAGTYEFKFDCTNKDLSMILLDGGRQTNMLCTATSSLSSNSFRIIPQLKNENTFVDSYIYVSFYDAGKNTRQALGKTVLTVRTGTMRGVTNSQTTNATSSAVVKTKVVTSNTNATSTNYTNKTTTNPVVNTPNVIRKSDLYIKTKDTGVVINNVFVPKTTFGSYESASVRFDIGNDGNIPTGPWQFTAILPTYPSQVFPSGVQPSLAPGEIIEYTLSMQNLASAGNNVITINVDLAQMVPELSETNNGVVMTVFNSGVGYNANTIPNYNTGYYYNSNSDLMLRIISKGYIGRNNGRYYEASSVSEDDRVAVRFEIENIGKGETGPFIYTANLSGYSNDQYTSPVITSFYPGEKRQYTVDFNSGVGDIGTNTVTIRLDTYNNVNETNESNNVLSEDVRIY